MKVLFLQRMLWVLLYATAFSCRGKNTTPAPEAINALDLKRGDLISCGTTTQQFGSVTFAIAGSSTVKAAFTLGLKLLHSFEYDEAEKVFASIIDEQPSCAMAYWGIAMSNFHPLWTPPSIAELTKGSKAVAIAQTLPLSKKETAYIDAIAAFYTNWEKVDHRSRCLNFEKAMEKLHATWPDDHEAAALYALALNAAADPADKTFQKQQKAGAILQALFPGEPNHPGIVHYLIHTYDAPELAARALPAARKYASVAPSSAHALHMPSHIFTRLGLWDEDIQSNLASVSSAQCYAQAIGKEHWDEELHGMDYLVYAYLQKGDNTRAKQQVDILNTIREVHPANFKVAYAFAAIPSRFLLENKYWKEAAGLKPPTANLVWNNFPWAKAIVHFTRLMGAVHTSNKEAANAELQVLKQIQDTLIAQKDLYQANQVDIQIKTGEAWIHWKAGRQEEALNSMSLAAELEDKTEKHPVTPGEVIPAREFLGDLLLQLNKPDKALEAYEEDLKKHPNRFNGLYGAGLAAQKTGNMEKAGYYYKQLLTIADVAGSKRPELEMARVRIPKD
jgi:tetratricopeptide (TPR) repeat protein